MCSQPVGNVVAHFVARLPTPADINFHVGLSPLSQGYSQQCVVLTFTYAVCS